MKKITRLTAMLVSLVLLLGNISASAMGFEEGIPIDELDLASYEQMLSDAEAVGLAESKPCSSSNPYCASVTKLVKMATAQERYNYLAGMSSVQAISVLMHYNDYQDSHTAENILCLCAYPNFDAAYAPGGINHAVDCPWHFANMLVSEQYYILNGLDAEAQSAYKAMLTEEQLKKLDAFVREISYFTPCDPATCPFVDQYVDFFSMDVFYVYEYLSELRSNTLEDDGDEGKDFSELWLHLRNNHIADSVVCQCGSCDFTNSDHKYGRDHHKMGYEVDDLYIVCPWRIDQMTMEEQALVVKELGGTIPEYFSEYLTVEELEELNAFLAGVGKTEQTITAQNPDNAEQTLVTANITVPSGVFGEGITHVMEAGEALMTTEKVNALNAAMTGHTLAAFDISFYNLNRPGEKLQPVNGTVPLNFTVDVNDVDGDSMQVYHLIENADGTITVEAAGSPIVVDKSNGTQTITVQADSFSTWLIEGLCSGDTATCSYNEFAAMSGFERAEMLKELVGSASTKSLDEYNKFYNHLTQYHSKTTAVCFCFGNAYEIVQYGYGTLLHVKGSDLEGNAAMCPWHFSEISVEDQYIIIEDMDEAEREQYMDDAGLSEDQKTALKNYIDSHEVMCVVDGDYLMCEGKQLAYITENGYIVDIETGIAVGRYDRESETFIMGTGSN